MHVCVTQVSESESGVGGSVNNGSNNDNNDQINWTIN